MSNSPDRAADRRLPPSPGEPVLRQAGAADSEKVDREGLRQSVQDHLAEIGLNGARGAALSKDDIRAMHRFHREAARASCALWAKKRSACWIASPTATK